MTRALLIGLGAAVLACTGANCIPNGNDKPRLSHLKRFESPEALRRFLAEQAQDRLFSPDRGTDGWSDWGWLWSPLPTGAADDVALDDADGAAPPSNDAGGQEDAADAPYSTTNVQEEGVDESDIIKNDGQYIYWLHGRTVHVIQAAPANALTELATFELDHYAQAMFLREGKLVVLANEYMYYDSYPSDPPNDDVVRSEGSSEGSMEGGSGSAGVADAPNVKPDTAARGIAQDVPVVGGSWNDGSQVVVTIIDVSDPANPVLDKVINLEGSMTSSRMINNRLFLVLTTTPRLPDSPSPEAIEGMGLDEWIPDYQVVNASGVVASGDMTGWEGFYRPDVGDGYGITTVVTIDVDSPEGDMQSTSITADAGTIYASTQALYITDTEYDWSAYESRTDTLVHKLAFTDEGTDYVASGLVPGRPLNQYSLGEYEGNLRIATTNETYRAGGADISSGVYVLAAEDTMLNVIGQVEGIAAGETIYACRFVGERGFVVTFKRIDPLFTLDLSDPTNPQITGELKVPGYSDHIQMLDADHLLTIGKDAQDAGGWAWVQGVQLSIFDVADMNNPTLLHKTIIGGRGTDSEANYNPKAFNYFAPANALAFPIDIYSAGTDGPEIGRHEFNGLIVFDVSLETGFTELGRLSAVDDNDSLEPGCYYNYWGSSRGVFIGHTIYAVSDLGVKAAELDDMSTLLGQTSLTGSAPDMWCDTPYEPWFLPEGDDVR